MPEGEGVPDVEEEEPQDKEEEEMVNETMFSFDQFEQVRGSFAPSAIFTLMSHAFHSVSPIRTLHGRSWRILRATRSSPTLTR